MIKVLVCLVLGGVTTVAVTWGFAIKLDIRDSTYTARHRILERPHGGVLGVSRRSRRGAVHLYASAGWPPHGPSESSLEGSPEDLVPRWAINHLLPWGSQVQDWPQGGYFSRDLDARGWPQLSFWCVTARKIGRLPIQPAAGGIQLPDRWVMEHDRQWLRLTTLPCRPIWSGFAMNTIFYAAILWFLTLGPFAARRLIRRRRGRCIECGYDLRGAEHEVCPECGAAT